jgi:ribosome-associated translation inhibitor RaiA
MQIRVRIDANIEKREKLADYVARVVESSMRRFGTRISRVDVHLSDEGGTERGKGQKRCVIEARVERHQPTVVAHQAVALDQAVDGATDRLERAVENMLERLHDFR